MDRQVWKGLQFCLHCSQEKMDIGIGIMLIYWQIFIASIGFYRLHKGTGTDKPYKWWRGWLCQLAYKLLFLHHSYPQGGGSQMSDAQVQVCTWLWKRVTQFLKNERLTRKALYGKHHCILWHWVKFFRFWSVSQWRVSFWYWLFLDVVDLL